MNETICWDQLPFHNQVVLKDTELNIDLELNITLSEVDKVILECTDFIYTIVITKEMWENGRFVFSYPF